MLGLNKAPKKIEDKKASRKQDRIFLSGAFMGLIAFGAFSNGDYLLMLIFGGLSFAAFYSGSKIKTHFEAKGQTTHYGK
ncbi:hypothetical protein K7H22_19080 [Seohaeicola saemankumensis]|uniref:hypothetical protein n=1 Tax=Seohaeicola saemankumensis TaxID=481181 RepID=UPI001E3E4D1E|nr:hypothetical protein [Seohaeicola saemankumensis]MCD1628101.1 hypothetical protein [Seohaeicola saemankumensis]